MKTVDKDWGYELWITNTSKYCGKLLFFREDKKCSFHYHKLKDETFYLQSGKLIVRYSFTDDYDNDYCERLDIMDTDKFEKIYPQYKKI